MYRRTATSAISHKQLRPKLYSVWVSMKQRCRPGGQRSKYHGDKAIAESLERENEYWQRVGGRTDGVTDAVGWKERWELMLRELP